MTSGIYGIKNIVSNKIYIGQSLNVKRRLSYHLYRLRIGLHPNIHLQSSWNKHGESKFQFLEIEYCKAKILSKRENYWCKEYKSFDREYGYNIAIVEDRGYKLPKESCIKIGNKHRGKVLPEDTKRKISEFNKGKKLSDETREIMRIKRTGKKHSVETKLKISEIQKTRWKEWIPTEKWISTKRKPVFQMDINCNPIKKFSSITEASIELNIEATSIVACCKGKKLTTKGYKFKYVI